MRMRFQIITTALLGSSTNPRVHIVKQISLHTTHECMLVQLLLTVLLLNYGETLPLFAPLPSFFLHRLNPPPTCLCSYLYRGTHYCAIFSQDAKK